MKLDILAFGAHPDDVELGCGALIAKEISLGKKVGIVDLTRGELGTRGSAEIRDQEAAEAAKILGVSVRKNLGFRDGFFKNDEEHQLQIIECIRFFQPDIVLCNAQSDRHIDHGRGASLVSDACFLSGLVKVKTGTQDAWRPKNVFHYMQWNNDAPDFVVDVSGFMEPKKKAILAYGSQFFDPKSTEPTTPISTQGFLDNVFHRASDLGRLIGVAHAEGFTSQKMIGVNRLDLMI